MKTRGNRFLYALLTAALVCWLLPVAALAIGSASIDGSSPVTGTTGSPINTKPFTLMIAGNSLNTIPSSAEFTSWIQNMPAGLRVTVESGSPSTEASIHITIDGAPTQSSDAPFTIVIPREKLHDPPASDMPVTVDTYSNAWWNISPSADSVIAVSLDGGTSYTPYADFATGWNAAVGSGNTANTKVKLLQNWTAGTGGFGTGDGFQYGGIVVPHGKTVALDLCGKTVSANANVTDSAVFVVGSLALSDSGSGGKLTGATQGCVHILSTGSLTMHGGSITGNAADTAAINGNVYVGGSFSVSGSASVAGNTKNGSPCNVYLPNGKTVTVPSGLSQSAHIGVTTQTPPARNQPVAVTNAGISNCSASFTSDAGYTVEYDATAYHVQLTYPALPAIAVALNGDNYISYTDFADGWNVAVGSGNTRNTKVRLLDDWTAGANGLGAGGGFQTGGIVVPAGKTVALDLCGKTVTANANVTGRAVTVNGKLTLSDSGTGGKLTGATHGCVYVATVGTFTMSGGQISDNTTDGDGAGVYVDGRTAAEGTFTMSGGEISGNHADGNGGGVYSGVFVRSVSFEMSGGSITGNTAGNQGGGVRSIGNLVVYGQVQITGNTVNSSPNNVYLAGSQLINSNTANGPSVGSIIGVTTQNAPVPGSPTQVTVTNAKNQIGCFTSDDMRYTVQDTLNHVVMLIVGQRINVAITPTNQFSVGNASGNLTVNVGHGIPDAELGVSHISTVKMDDAVLRKGPGADYTITNGGSVLIALHQSYLNTLPVGRHTLSVAIGSGTYGGVTVATDITVTPVTPVTPVTLASDAPKTGDDAQPWLWLGLALAAGAASGAGIVLWRKRRKG